MEMTLSPKSRSQVSALAEDLSWTAPRLVDDQKWLAAARAASGLLPAGVREAIRGFRHDPGEDAVLVVHGLPVDGSALPPTPAMPDSVARNATPTSSVLALLTLQLGELVAFKDEKQGALVQNVVPVPGQEVEQSNAGSTSLKMHVENAFHPHRPDVVNLFCLRSDHDCEADLQVVSVRKAAPLLPPAARNVLSRPWFRTVPPPSFNSGQGEPVDHAVLLGDTDDPSIRIDFCATHPRNETAGGAMAELASACTAVAKTIKLRPGDFVAIDNRLAMHGRTAFNPRNDGQDRWLQRAFVLFDYRRSRSARPEGGCVLT
jgi:L-asparagine oxygenase